MFNILVTFMIGAFLFSGLRSSREGSALSVASARAAKVSIIKFTQSNWTAFKTLFSSPPATLDTKVMTIAVTLTAS